MFTGVQLSYAFIGGMLAGISIGITAALLWDWANKKFLDADKPRHVAPKPRKTSMPKIRPRVQGRPTNINEPPSSVRQAQIRFRRETKD